MKKTGLFKIISFILLGMIILTWIFSASMFSDGNLSELGMLNVGFFDLFSLLFRSFSFTYFTQIFIFLISVGALYGVLEKTGKYRAWIEKITKNLKGREIIFLILCAFSIAVLTSLIDYGICTFVIFPLLISIILALGYDKITACLATFGSLLIGMLGSTTGYNTSGVIAEVLSVDLSTAIYYKLALLGFSFAALLFFLSKAKHNPKEKEEDLFMGENISNKYSNNALIIVLSLVTVFLLIGCAKWAVLTNSIVIFTLITLISLLAIIFVLLNNSKKVSYIIALVAEAFMLCAAYLYLPNVIKNRIVVIVILAIILVGSILACVFTERLKKIPLYVVIGFVYVGLLLLSVNYTGTINEFSFENLHESITNYSPKLPYVHITNDGIDSGKQEFAIFGKILGQGNAIGDWQYAEMAIVCFFASLLVGWLYRVKGIFRAMFEGAKKMLKPAFMVLFAYSVVYFAGNQMFYPTMANLLLTITKKFSVFFGSVTAVLGSFFHVDMLYVANYVAPQIADAGASSSLTILLMQGLYGVTMLIAPTSCILVLGLTYLEIPYKDWVKRTWKLVLVLLAIVEVVLVLARYVK